MSYICMAYVCMADIGMVARSIIDSDLLLRYGSGVLLGKFGKLKNPSQLLKGKDSCCQEA